MRHSHNSLSTLTAVFQTLHNERGQEIGQKLCQRFFCKTFFRANEQIPCQRKKTIFLLYVILRNNDSRAIMILNVYPPFFVLKLALVYFNVYGEAHLARPYNKASLRTICS